MGTLASLHHLSDWALLVLRLGLGTVFLVHGIQKRAMWKMQPSAQMPAGLLTIIKVLSIAEPLSGLAMIRGLPTPGAAGGGGRAQVLARPGPAPVEKQPLASGSGT